MYNVSNQMNVNLDMREGMNPMLRELALFTFCSLTTIDHCLETLNALIGIKHGISFVSIRLYCCQYSWTLHHTRPWPRLNHTTSTTPTAQQQQQQQQQQPLIIPFTLALKIRSFLHFATARTKGRDKHHLTIESYFCGEVPPPAQPRPGVWR